MDEHGRDPGNPGYRDRDLHDREWETHNKAKEEWAKRRVGHSVAHVDKFSPEERVGDAIMQDYLSAEGLAPPRMKPEHAQPETDSEGLVEQQQAEKKK